MTGQNSQFQNKIPQHLQNQEIIYSVPADTKKNRPAQKYKVRVSYSDHCYTSTNPNGNGRRIFDKKRYYLSKNLPQIINDLMNRKCSFASGRNYYTIHTTSNNEEYEVCFEVYKRKETGTLALEVHSAYVRDPNNIGNRPKWKSIRFSVILYNTLHAKTVKRTQK